MPNVTATYDSVEDHIVLTGSGYSPDIPVHVIYTHPDGSTETWYMGVMGGDLDVNFLIAHHLVGIWRIDVYQGTDGHGKHSSAKLVASTTVEVT